MISIKSTIYPIGAYNLHGLVWQIDGNTSQPYAVCIDAYQGHLLKIDPISEGAMVLNSYTAQQFCDATGIAIAGETLWIAKGNTIFYCDLIDFDLQPFMELPNRIDGIAVSDGGVYVSSSEVGQIFVFGRATRTLLRIMDAPGAGFESLTLKGEELWVSDRTEETVYRLNSKTGEVIQRGLTPFPNATGLGFLGEDLYVVYSGDEKYIRENPNDLDEPFSVALRESTFIHRLRFQQYQDQKLNYTLTTGYKVEMIYLEELSSEEPTSVYNLTWRIAYPTDTYRQKLLAIEPIGVPFVEEIVDGQKVAAFHLGNLKPQEAKLFGWKATLELHGIKYELKESEVDFVPELSEEMQKLYLIDDDGLSMDHPIIQAAARDAVGDETNILRKMRLIRDYVYDQLSYRVTPYIASPEEVLQRGTGSCGEYVGLLLALTRLNGIACRTVGRYKCPHDGDLVMNVPLHQYYNHVWIEFYIPGVGWLPMESNPDDTGERPYPTRWFMGLPWYHVEIGKGIFFETIQPQPYSIGELSLNHVRFKVLEEI
ncbi:MAG: transglutaminase domain-containing protein [Pseudanabaenaceae cyanobacterium bins.39]|nr:transglutaminase domain-containing protein [Pseudanabaenaceae cyanobacterium bins.39]